MTMFFKSSQQKQTASLWSNVAVKLDSAFTKLCVCVKKSNFLSWAIRTVFVDPVTYGIHVGAYFLSNSLCSTARKYIGILLVIIDHLV